MAAKIPMRHALRRLAHVLMEYATSRGWNADQCQIYFLADEPWGRIMILFVGPFAENPEIDVDEDTERDAEWGQIVSLLETRLKDDPRLVHSFDLALRRPEEMVPNGFYFTDPEVIEARELET